MPERRHADGHEYVTKAYCKEMHGMNKKLIMLLFTLFLGLLGAAGWIGSMFTRAQELCPRVEQNSRDIVRLEGQQKESESRVMNQIGQLHDDMNNQFTSLREDLRVHRSSVRPQ